MTFKPWLTRKGRRIDFAELDAANRRLGLLGEEFVFDLERHRLLRAGRDDLAQRVIWASRDMGMASVLTSFPSTKGMIRNECWK